MTVETFCALSASIAVLNALVYFLFVKFLVKTHNPGMKFLLINIPKDVAWCVFWLMKLHKSTGNFLIITTVFLVASVVVYGLAIRKINRL